MYDDKKTVVLTPGKAVMVKGIRVSLDRISGPTKFMVVVDNSGMLNKYWVDGTKEIEIVPKVLAKAVKAQEFPHGVRMLLKFPFGVKVEPVPTS